LNNVYAVTRTGGLRWITTEAIASTLYGADWNTKVDDIADTFYGDYTFGNPVTDLANINLTSEMETTKTIDDTL
jgi:hypothetical protein